MATAAPARARTRRAALALLVFALATLAVELRRQGVARGPDFVPDERPIPAPLVPRAADLAPGAPLARSLELYLLDGLRVDAAEASEAWRELAPRGARLRARARFPVFSAPGRSLIVTGAPPEVTGIVGNGRKADGKTDSLLARAAAAGLVVSHPGEGEPWDAWLGLAPFEHHAPGAAHPRSLRIEDWFECDHAGHEHGAASDAYRRAVADVSARLIACARRADLSRDVVLAVADHGHTDGGGHLGVEPEVATVPVLLLGAGVRAGYASEEPIALEDAGATAAFLLGLEPAELSRGVPALDALLVPDARRPALLAAFRARRDELARSWDEAVSPGRVLLLRALAAALVLAVGVALAPPSLDRTAPLALAAPALAFALWALVAPPMSANAGARWLVPEYLAVFAGGLGPVLVLGRVLGLDAARLERNLLVAWLLPVVLLLARFGIGPGGLAPSPLVFALVLAAGFLSFYCALVLAAPVGERLRGRPAAPS